MPKGFDFDDTTKKFIAALQEKQVDPFEIDADIAEEHTGEDIPEITLENMFDFDTLSIPFFGSATSEFQADIDSHTMES
ncbi:hypothetical protein HK096_000788, partial [Nowakowskiella sp. JEL0078]